MSRRIIISSLYRPNVLKYLAIPNTCRPNVLIPNICIDKWIIEIMKYLKKIIGKLLVTHNLNLYQVAEIMVYC